VIVLVTRERALPLGSIREATACDLALVDRLARLRLVASRCGWSIQLTEVDQDLRELLDLAGLTDCLAP